jgi:hypothetical protein
MSRLDAPVGDPAAKGRVSGVFPERPLCRTGRLADGFVIG